MYRKISKCTLTFYVNYQCSQLSCKEFFLNFYQAANPNKKHFLIYILVYLHYAYHLAKKHQTFLIIDE